MFKKGTRSQEASYTTSPKVSDNIKSGVFFFKIVFQVLKATSNVDGPSGSRAVVDIFCVLKRGTVRG